MCSVDIDHLFFVIQSVYQGRKSITCDGHLTLLLILRGLEKVTSWTLGFHLYIVAATELLAQS